MCAPVRVADHHGWAHLPKPDTAADAPPQVRIVPQERERRVRGRPALTGSRVTTAVRRALVPDIY